ncbi:MAG: Mrp/NBP35 family ATP-binding protein [Clostridia bacterium]|nr:Mrp/NBP35 family ATP-binding protein [Clostridia bacterium]MBR3640180.1 Mrp/NBP35 family ATP-binding protein [Clostridia bacterium]
MAECTHDCSSCSENCESRNAPQREVPRPDSHIKHVIGVVSGKGGVGKSIVTSMLAVAAAKKGFKTAVLDADVTGPSIPKSFGVSGQILQQDGGLLPLESEKGIKIMSLNLLLEDETSPVVWRGPVIAGAVKQFWTDVVWGDVDYMFVDMPPGTGDVPLTVFQSIPLDGVIVVTTPQSLVSMIVEKAVRMADLMSIPVLGIVENMSYITCPDCGKKIEVFGESRVERIAAEYGIPKSTALPLDPSLAYLIDEGKAEDVSVEYLDKLADLLF